MFHDCIIINSEIQSIEIDSRLIDANAKCMLIHITKMVAMIVVKIPFFKVKACAESSFWKLPEDLHSW